MRGRCESTTIRPLHYFRLRRLCNVQTAPQSGKSSIVLGMRVHFFHPNSFSSVSSSAVFIQLFVFISFIFYLFLLKADSCILEFLNIKNIKNLLFYVSLRPLTHAQPRSLSSLPCTASPGPGQPSATAAAALPSRVDTISKCILNIQVFSWVYVNVFQCFKNLKFIYLYIKENTYFLSFWYLLNRFRLD